MVDKHELLGAIAELEPFTNTLTRFPELTREALLQALGCEPSAPSREPVAAEGALLIYTDGASRGNPGPASAGVVIAQPNGTVLAQIGRRLGTGTNNYAEYEAIRIGLERAVEMQAESVELRADSQLAVRQLTGIYKVKNEKIRPLYQAVKALEGRISGGVRYTHVRREANKHADELANFALDGRPREN